MSWSELRKELGGCRQEHDEMRVLLAASDVRLSRLRRLGLETILKYNIPVEYCGGGKYGIYSTEAWRIRDYRLYANVTLPVLLSRIGKAEEENQCRGKS